MSSLRHAHSNTQPFMQPYSIQASNQRLDPSAAQRYSEGYTPGPAHGATVHQRAAELAPRLHPAECRVLMDVVAPLLFARPDPYVPPRDEPEQIARVLVANYGLLTPVSSGYVGAYRPTLLGVAVIWRFLLDQVRSRPGGVAYAW